MDSNQDGLLASQSDLCFLILKQYVLAIFRVGAGDGRLGAHSALTQTVGRFHSALC